MNICSHGFLVINWFNITINVTSVDGYVRQSNHLILTMIICLVKTQQFFSYSESLIRLCHIHSVSLTFATLWRVLSKLRWKSMEPTPKVKWITLPRPCQAWGDQLTHIQSDLQLLPTKDATGAWSCHISAIYSTTSCLTCKAASAA